MLIIAEQSTSRRFGPTHGESYELGHKRFLVIKKKMYIYKLKYKNQKIY